MPNTKTELTSGPEKDPSHCEKKQLSLETICVHGDGHRLIEETRPISFPIYQTASFSHIKPGHNSSGYDYTRESNPSRHHLEEVVSALEGATDTLACSSGMAAISLVFSLFRAGDHILLGEDLYGGVVRYGKLIASQNHLAFQYVDTRDLSLVEASITPNTRAIYLETPSNPMMHVSDLRALGELAKKNNLLFIVDNTFLSPYFQNPLLLGADIVVHSGSKFLSGHNDTIAGFVCSKDPELAARLRLHSKTTGANLAPFDCWLVERGIKTLAVRMERQQATALKLASYLKGHPYVTQVLYLGLEELPGYALNASQSRGYGSMISFHVDTPQRALNLLQSVKLITFAESLGGTESLLTYPALQTHPDVPVEVREKLGITDTLLRFSVGLEQADDLIADLEQGLN